MNNEERLFCELNKLEIIAKESIGATAEKWLNIAYKFDYIPLSCKEKIDNLLRKKDEIERFNVKHSILDNDVEDTIAIVSIASNTRFSKLQLEMICKDIF